MAAERSPMERAVALLARREHAAAELRGKLIRAGISEPEAAEVVRRLSDAGLQSDDRYTEMLVRGRASRGQGPIRVRAELERFDIDERLIRRHLESESYDWSAEARRALLKKFPDPPDDFRDKARRLRFLARRGFDHDQIDHALAGYEPGEP